MTAVRADELHMSQPEGASPAELDRLLAVAFKSGETGAYDAIYGRYNVRVRSICKRMLGSTDDASEATQETFLRVYQALGKFNGRYQLGAWISRIATNVCLDQIRSRNRKPADLVEGELLALEAEESPDGDPEEFVLRRAESRRVRRVLDGLPPLHRAAIVLRDFEGYSYEDIGRILSLTDCQVKALIHRARQGFKRSWASQVASVFLFPGRLVHKLRDGDVRVKEQAAQAVTQASQTTASCSMMLQQCGQFLTERAAGVLVGTTVVVGAGFGGYAATQPAGHFGSDPAPASITAEAPEAGERMARPRMDRPAQTERAAVVDTEPESEVPSAEPPEEPVVEPSPSPEVEPEEEETPPPSEPGDGGTKPVPDPSAPPPSPPAPVAFTSSFSFEGTSVTPTTPLAHSASVDCNKMTTSQSMDSWVGDADGSHPAHMDVNVSNSMAMTLTVNKKGHSIRYTGSGVLTSSSTSNYGYYRTLTFAGSYGTGSAYATVAGLPNSGRLQAEIVFDCANGLLVSESVVLTHG